MKGFDYSNVRISGISCVLPERKTMTRDYIGHFQEKEIEKFIQTTGIEQRYLSNGKQTAGDLCYIAADNLMKHKNLSGNDIDAIIFMTQEPDYYSPATAFTLHKRLGVKKECLVFDANIGCSSFTVGLATVGGLIQGGMIERALLLIGDAKCAPPDNDNTTDTLMFGAGGTATLLEKGDARLYGINMSDGSGYDVIIEPAPGMRFPHAKAIVGQDTYFNNDDTFLFTITEVPKLFKEFFKLYGNTIDDFDYYMLHQPNLMILNHIAKRIKIPDGRMHVSINRYGNTDGATIPLGIADLCINNNSLPSKLHLISSGFGIGLSWGIAAFELNISDVLPIVYTDYYWEEGFEIGKQFGYEGATS